MLRMLLGVRAPGANIKLSLIGSIININISIDMDSIIIIELTIIGTKLQ